MELARGYVELQALVLAVRFPLLCSSNLYMEVVFSSEAMISC